MCSLPKSVPDALRELRGPGSVAGVPSPLDAAHDRRDRGRGADPWESAPRRSETGDPPSGTHPISLFCDGIRATEAELQSRGVEFDREIREQDWGFETIFTMPGGVYVQLLESRYRKASVANTRARTRRSARHS